MASIVSACRGRPNPARAHGAWIYLLLSVASGVLLAVDQEIRYAVLVGAGFVGAFLAAAALSVPSRRSGRLVWFGAGTAAAGPAVALWFEADSRFLIVGGLAALLGGGAILLEKWFGFLSFTALAVGLAALAIAAPVSAIAGGAGLGRGAALFAFLWPFFCWRTFRIAAPLQSGEVWNRHALKARGLREAAIAAAWSLGVTMALRGF